MSFARPHYLVQMLASLKANDLDGCEIWLFQDGNRCHITGEERADEAKIERCVELFGQAMPDGHVVRHRCNLGIGLNRLSLLSHLSLEYPAFIQLENDLELSPNCVGVMKKLIADFADAEDVGLIRSPLMDHGDNVLACSLLHDPGLNKFEFGAFVTTTAWFTPVLAQYRRYCDIIRNYPYKPHETYADHAATLMGSEHIPASDKALLWATESTCRYAWIMGAPRVRTLGLEGESISPTLAALLERTILQKYPDELTTTWQRVYG